MALQPIQALCRRRLDRRQEVIRFQTDYLEKAEAHASAFFVISRSRRRYPEPVMPKGKRKPSSAAPRQAAWNHSAAAWRGTFDGRTFPDRFPVTGGRHACFLPEYPREMRQVVEPDRIADFRHALLRMFKQPASRIQTVSRDELRKSHPLATLEPGTERRMVHARFRRNIIQRNMMDIMFHHIRADLLHAPHDTHRLSRKHMVGRSKEDRKQTEHGAQTSQFISDNTLRIVRELSRPNFNASAGNSTPASLFRSSGNNSTHRSTNEWLKATIR